MAQGGDPTGTGYHGSDLPDLKAEFSGESHKRGIASMARSQNPNSANSQFFIVTQDSPFLDNQYTVWGEVESGMEHVDALPEGEPPREPGQDRQGDASKGRLNEEGRARYRRVGRPRGRVRAPAVEARPSAGPRRAAQGEARARQRSSATRAPSPSICRRGAAAKLMADIETNGETVDLLVNNAGFGLIGQFAEPDAAR